MKLNKMQVHLIAGLGYQTMDSRLIDQTDRTGSAAKLRGRQSLPNSLKKNQKNFTDILEHGILSRWFNYDIEYDLADKKSGKQGMRHYRRTLNNVS